MNLFWGKLKQIISGSVQPFNAIFEDTKSRVASNAKQPSNFASAMMVIDRQWSTLRRHLADSAKPFLSSLNFFVELEGYSKIPHVIRVPSFGVAAPKASNCGYLVFSTISCPFAIVPFTFTAVRMSLTDRTIRSLSELRDGPRVFTERAKFFNYTGISQGMNLHRLGLALVRLVRLLQQAFGPFLFYHNNVIAAGPKV